MSDHDPLKIWNRMSPADRDYDRFVARRVPAGASREPETEAGKEAAAALLRDYVEVGARGCSCHIVAPCSFCVAVDDNEVRKLGLG